MATATMTHNFEEVYHIDKTFVKMGEVRILWGFISYPKIIVKEIRTNFGVCRLCGQSERTDAHGYYKLNSKY